MAYTPYHTRALLPAGSDLTDVPGRLGAHLGLYLKDVRVRRRKAGPPELIIGAYPFFITVDDLNAHPDVAEDAERTLTRLGTPEEQGRGCGALLAWGGTQPDPDMTHFNDSVFLAQAVESLFPSAILFDPSSGERI